MWGLPGPGLEPISPALAGGLLTTAPPGKPWPVILEGVNELNLFIQPIMPSAADYAELV